MNGKKITLLVTGSIAAYKSAELVRELVKHGASVHVVMSRAAEKFITPLTLQTLSGNPVTTDLFDVVREGQINHIRLADQADVVLVAPATADVIAKAAAGIADDSVTTVLLATKSPVVIAPAMNVNMWQNSITQRNITTLKNVGWQFVEPESGELACGWFGEGRLAELDSILGLLSAAVSPKDLLGRRVIVTAGPTRGIIDPVRFITNRSSGKMGYAIAERAKARGADVVLISGPTSLKPPAGVTYYSVLTAAEMRDKVLDVVMSHEPNPQTSASTEQVLFMVAAVTDHMPGVASDKKLKQDKAKGYTIEMVPCPDILQELGERREEIARKSGRALKLVGFSAESGEAAQIVRWAEGKLQRKQVDLMVGNSIEDAFETDTNRVWLLSKHGGILEVPQNEKSVIAETIIDAAMKL